MASADDLASAFSKAERAAGRPLPLRGTVLLAVDGESPSALTEIASQLSRAGLELVATRETALVLTDAGHRVRVVTSSAPAELVREDGCVLVITAANGSGNGLAHGLRAEALAAGIPCITSIAGAVTAARAVSAQGNGIPSALQDRLRVLAGGAATDIMPPLVGALRARKAVSSA
jgi:carbamoyl-phosphate synthase large subunit